MTTPERILITAGPTHERIDDVRYLANRSSGRMGIALAEAACRAGLDVTLLLGPAEKGVGSLFSDRLLELPAKAGFDCSPEPGTPAVLQKKTPAPLLLRFESTADLEALLERHFPDCDLLIMAAAVADYRPAAAMCVSGKLPRKGEKLVLELEPTPDLVAGCAARKRADQRIIAFALEEPARLAQRAVEKMRAKGVDAIVANPLQTMGSASVSATIYTADGSTVTPNVATLDKSAFADWLIEWLQQTLWTR